MTPTDCTSGGGFGDLFDIPGMIVNAVTAFLGMIVEQVMKPLRELLASNLLATPDVTAQADIRQMWTGSLSIAAGIYVLFVTAGGITVMGYETVQSRYAFKQIAPRLLVGVIAAATSLTVMGKAIALANALSRAVMGTDLSDAGQGLVERVIPFALFGVAGVKVYLLLLAMVMIVLVVAVLVGYMVRVAVIAVLAVAAPLALSCHAHPATDGVARLWWRGLAATLAIQVAQSMTFIVALKLFFAPGAMLLGFPRPSQLGTILAGLALFWVLFKIPGWCARIVFRSTPVSPRMPGPFRMVQSVAMWRLLNHYGRGFGSPRRGGGRSTGGRSTGGGSGGSGGQPGGPRGGGGRPPRPGPGGIAGSAVRRGRTLTAGMRARGARFGTAPNTPGPGPGGGTPQTTGTASPRTSGGPRSVMHPVQARRAQQLKLPIPAKRNPARPPRPVQTWLPIRAERGPAPPRAARPLPATPPPAGRNPVPRARQLALPVPATRVRMRPPRPMQLRLPLEPPRR
ncbi:hypothetical protein NGB36_14805 [Streptomyces sp. RB6PN25]|uniref:TrbL/VirB6 plasmid conjugal transfer protein n=1 Tax=Streptomyces humicola TaxID=2953240 RepID=A0ABT1PVZ1_9ACTN|nr:hypothetical protein [Streptomyces humicola]MCQ4081843.1 hypothetical protein [Streptomyces humicola]